MKSESGSVDSKLKQRLENLSDLVFGLALSIGSVILISKIPQAPVDLVTGIVVFGESFLIVVWIWSGYTRLMIVLPWRSSGHT